mmetsp:Transcript_113977/g.354935  ORF Transcript_113977/g.354935 Transcript_113977/m.354935 type:complete len:286 (-) Transcript_113977:386-1243(-)
MVAGPAKRASVCSKGSMRSSQKTQSAQSTKSNSSPGTVPPAAASRQSSSVTRSAPSCWLVPSSGSSLSATFCRSQGRAARVSVRSTFRAPNARAASPASPVPAPNSSTERPRGQSRPTPGAIASRYLANARPAGQSSELVASASVVSREMGCWKIRQEAPPNLYSTGACRRLSASRTPREPQSNMPPPSLSSVAASSTSALRRGRRPSAARTSLLTARTSSSKSRTTRARSSASRPSWPVGKPYLGRTLSCASMHSSSTATESAGTAGSGRDSSARSSRWKAHSP